MTNIYKKDYEQTSLFDVFDDYQIGNKPIAMIEFFGGIGSQSKAMSRITNNFTHHKLAEWSIPSILAYNEIHQDKLPNYGKDFTQGMTKEDLANKLFELGVSKNYSEPATLKQLMNMSEQDLRNVLNAIKSTNNLVNITKVHAKDLELQDRSKEYICSWSFPCQDLSKSGKLAGCDEHSGTRSSLCFECIRIFQEAIDLGTPINVLIMENVPDILQSKNLKNFLKLEDRLSQMGYCNFVKVIEATSVNVPQHRSRAFMVSIYGKDINYKFPREMKLTRRLKDILEKGKVDDKYYLSDQMIQGMIKTNFESYKIENNIIPKDGIAPCLIARYEGCPYCVCDQDNLDELVIMKEDGILTIPLKAND